MAIGNTLYGNTTPVRVSESGNPVVTIVVEQVFFLSFPCTFPTKLENLFHKNNRYGIVVGIIRCRGFRNPRQRQKLTDKTQPATAVSIAGSLDHAGGRIELELGSRNRHRIIRILPYNIAFGGTRTGNRLVIFSFLTAYPEPAHILPPSHLTEHLGPSLVQERIVRQMIFRDEDRYSAFRQQFLGRGESGDLCRRSHRQRHKAGIPEKGNVRPGCGEREAGAQVSPSGLLS